MMDFRFIPNLQRLIDLSFQDRAMPFSFHLRDGSEGGDLQLKISRLQDEADKAWSQLSLSLQQFHKTRSNISAPELWDFFVAYASCDRWIADQIFSTLSKIGRTFLDSRCLRPGDRWTERIRAAQDNSRSTVLLITAETPSSWFVESEYLRAIQLLRSGKHVVIPVLYGEGAELPYGLEQVHAATARDWGEIDKLSDLVRHVLEQ